MTGNPSGRYYVIMPNGDLMRIPNRLYWAMIRDPDSSPIPRLARMRVKSAEVVVELRDRVPHRVVRVWFGYLSFDSRGVFDYDRYSGTERAKFDRAYGRAADWRSGSVVDAEDEFLVRGGTWAPSKAEATMIYEAALGMRRVSLIKQSVKPL